MSNVHKRLCKILSDELKMNVNDLQCVLSKLDIELHEPTITAYTTWGSMSTKTVPLK